MSNTGATFEGEIARSALKQGLLYQKLVVPIRVLSGGFTIPVDENPYDSYILRSGVHHALELKASDEHGSFPLSRIEPHQVQGLQTVLREQGQAWLLINMRCRMVQRIVSKKLGTTKEVRSPDLKTWALDFSRWDELKATLFYKNGKPRASIPRERLDDPEWFIPLPRIKLDGEYLWNLSPLLETQ